MDRLNVSILGVCKTRWVNNGDFVSNRHRVIYEGWEKNEMWVGLIRDEDKEVWSGILSIIS